MAKFIQLESDYHGTQVIHLIDTEGVASMSVHHSAPNLRISYLDGREAIIEATNAVVLYEQIRDVLKARHEGKEE